MAYNQNFSKLFRNPNTRKTLILALSCIAITVSLAVGLSVGLTQKHQQNSQRTSLPARSTCSPRPVGLKLPTPGTSWNYVLLAPIAHPSEIDSRISVWGIDLVDNNATSISTMKNKGANIICYFSAGSYEDWRPDASSFKPQDLGNDLDGWPGEKWLDIRSQNVRDIMISRLDLAVKKGCNGVDPDNVDGYNNDNGLDLREADSIDYVTFLSNEAHRRNLTVSLKNAGAIIPDVIDCVDFSVNEQCHEFHECDTYTAFIDHNKPVFHVEYPKGDDVNNNDPVSDTTKNSICKDSTATGFSTIIKNMNLDEWLEQC
jgi:uncharacterized protein (TIGR01370 family)